MSSRTPKNDLKQAACAVIEAEAERIIDISDHIMRHPETGYREVATAGYVKNIFQGMGLEYHDGLALTGVKARLRGAQEGPSVAVLGELDSLIVRDHPYADPVTNAAHACGHNAQVAAMVGAGLGLRTVMSELDGDVVLFATPAEECIETEWRLELKHQGQIEFLVGKAELIRLGHVDDIDMAMIVHTPHDDQFLASVGDSHNGCLIKSATFLGKAAHAGASPWLGINALKSATLGLTAIDAQRETFQEDDCIRIHPIVAAGGDAVSAVPSHVRVEMLVRGRAMDALKDAAEKVDRALRAGCLAMGAEVEITTLAAYLPHIQNSDLVRLTRQNQVALLGEEKVGPSRHVTGSTDVGDLSFVMPVVHPRSAGTTGAPHSRDYYVRHHYLAAVIPAKVMASTVIDLLCDGAAAAREVLKRDSKKMTAEEYTEYRRMLETVIRHTPEAP